MRNSYQESNDSKVVGITASKAAPSTSSARGRARKERAPSPSSDSGEGHAPISQSGQVPVDPEMTNGASGAAKAVRPNAGARVIRASKAGKSEGRRKPGRAVAPVATDESAGGSHEVPISDIDA